MGSMKRPKVGPASAMAVAPTMIMPQTTYQP